MHIEIVPVAAAPGNSETVLDVAGDTLIYDGISYDLSAVPEGGEATPEGEHPFIGTITRIDGVIHARVRALYDAATAEPHQPDDMAHWTIPDAEGPVSLPVVRLAEPAENPEEEEDGDDGL